MCEQHVKLQQAMPFMAVCCQKVAVWRPFALPLTAFRSTKDRLLRRERRSFIKREDSREPHKSHNPLSVKTLHTMP